MTDPHRELDLVLLGATGFVGRLTAGHLARHAPEGLRVGLAGRSTERLRGVADALGVRGWSLLEVDATDPASMGDLADRTRVVATTVGPYSRYGLPLVAACARAGTHYADLTGEVLFVRESVDTCHEAAVRSGARIVHSCGFDSVPSDLGVLLTAEAARADGEGRLARTTLHVRSVRGGVSGGTVASMRAQVVAAAHDVRARRVVADPYALSPDRAAEPDRDPDAHRTAGDRRPGRGAREGVVRAEPPGQPLVGLARRMASAVPVRREDDGRWTGPFAMSTYNTRVVRRSNALLGWAYGRSLRYAEVVDTGRSWTGPLLAGGMALGLAGAVAAMSFSPTRQVLDHVLPAPGEGPDPATRARGRFRVDVEATTTTGARYRTVVGADRDPGYDGTAVMLGESALCLALDEADLPARAGVLTPATALGGALADRLRARGFTLRTEHLAAPTG